MSAFFTPDPMPVSNPETLQTLLPQRWRGHAFVAVMPRKLIHTLYLGFLFLAFLGAVLPPEIISKMHVLSLAWWVLFLIVGVIHHRACKRAKQLNAELVDRPDETLTTT